MLGFIRNFIFIVRISINIIRYSDNGTISNNVKLLCISKNSKLRSREAIVDYLGLQP